MHLKNPELSHVYRRHNIEAWLITRGGLYVKVKPIAHYKPPVYPSKEEVLQNPYLLKTLPERWKGKACTVVAFSSLLLMILASCNTQDNVDNASNEAEKAVPLFIHGDGRGSFGCESVAPPAFLSEEEAFTVIAEEAQREGIIFEREAPTLKKVTVPVTNLDYTGQEKNTGRQKGDLVLDGYDEEKQIAFEFVSREDIQAWAGRSEVWSSVESYRFLEAAEVLAEGIKGQTSPLTVATFYDPHYQFDSEEIEKIIDSNSGDYNMMEDAIKERVKADLREQVRDFLLWLKGQGIL